MAKRGTPYNAPIWPQLRAFILDRDNHRCQIRRAGCTTRATQADHIIKWAEGGAWFDASNLRAACAHCNNSIAHAKS